MRDDQFIGDRFVGDRLAEIGEPGSVGSDRLTEIGDRLSAVFEPGGFSAISRWSRSAPPVGDPNIIRTPAGVPDSWDDGSPTNRTNDVPPTRRAVARHVQQHMLSPLPGYDDWVGDR